MTPRHDAETSRIAIAPAATSDRDVTVETEDAVPTVAIIRAAVEVAVARSAGPLVLAISGGRDSMALMRAMARWAPQRLAVVATFDHGTGGYATDSAALVAAEARRLGLNVVRERARMPAFTEAAWREARWGFLHRVARAYKGRVVTAHTRDDQAETIVMRAMRGAGARGLAALAAPSSIVRPWLPVSRAEVAAWAAAESVPFLDDPMNSSRRFQRGRVRHELLPALEAVNPGITATLLDLGEQAAVWRRGVEHFVDTLGIQRVSASVLRMPTAAFDRTTDAGRAILWPACFARLGIALDGRGTRELVRFSSSRRRGAHVELSGGSKVLRVGDARQQDMFELRLPVVRSSSIAAWTGRAEQLPARLGRFRFRRLSPTEARFAEDERWQFGVPVDAQVTIRGWQAGDRIFCAGAPAGRRVTRYFSDRHIPPLDRNGWPVVLRDGALLCVPGLCRALAAPNRPGWPDSIWYRCERESD